MSPVTRVGVTVTFLRMDQAPKVLAPGMGAGVQIVRVQAPSVPFYRYLYNTVGADYLWWLRRTKPLLCMVFLRLAFGRRRMRKRWWRAMSG